MKGTTAMRRTAAVALSALAMVEVARAAEAPARAAPPLPTPETPTGVFALADCPLSTSGARNVEAFPLVGALLLPLFQAVIKPVIGAGVDAIANAIEQRALERSASATARAAGEFYRDAGTQSGTLRFKPSLGCIVVVRAAFTFDDRQGDGALIAGSVRAPKTNADGLGLEPSWTAANIDKINKALRSLSRDDARPRPRSVAIASAPELYAEFPIVMETATAELVREAEKSKDGATPAPRPPEKSVIPVRFALVPSHFDYRVKGPRRGDEAKQVAIEISIAASVSGKDEPIRIYNHLYDFGARRPGDVRAMPQYEAPWETTPLPHLVKVSAPRSEQTGTVAANYNYVSFVPFVVTAIVTERGDPGDLERAIAQSIRADKDDIAAPFIKLTDDQFKTVFGMKPEDKKDEKK